MADVKKIKLGSTSYDIKDATARAGLEAKQDKLTAGTGITIDEDNVISALGFPIEPNVVYGVNAAEEQIAYHAGNLIEFEDGTLGNGLYRRLQYIEAHNDAYIDTGITADLSSEIYCKYALNTWQTQSANPQIVFGTSVSPNITGIQVRTYAGHRDFVVSAESSGSPYTSTYYTSLDTNVSEAHLLNSKFTDGEFGSSLFPPYMAGELNQSLRIMGTGDDTSLSDGKIYGFYVKLYTGADYAINLIPAKRISDNKVGMYDTVSGDFFTSETDTDFIAGPLATPVISTEIKAGVGTKVEDGIINVDTDLLQSKLTAGNGVTITESMVGVGYKGLEKINTGAYSSSNLPYIDLGFKFLPGQDQIEVGFSNFTPFVGKNLPYLATGLPEADKTVLFVGVVEGANPGSNDYGYYIDKQSTPSPYKEHSSTAMDVDIVVNYGGQIIVNNEVKYTKVGTLDTETEGTIRLFGFDSQSCLNVGSIRYFRFSRHGSLMMDLRPVKRVTDGVVGLYDVLQKKFYTSSNIYQFGAGQELTSTISAVKGEWEWVGAAGNTVELGNDTHARGSSDVVIGKDAQTYGGSFGVVIGRSATANGTNNTVVGYNSHASKNSSISYSACTVIGSTNEVHGSYNTVVGYLANAGDSNNTPQYSLAIGSSVKALNSESVVVGHNSQSNADYGIAIGTSSEVGSVGDKAVAIGYNAKGTGTDAVAIGYNSRASASACVQLGEGINGGFGTLKFRTFNLLDKDGFIPATRMASIGPGAEGTVLTLDDNDVPQWKPVNGLPSQSGQSGKFLTTNGSSASWAELDIPEPTYNATTKTISF